MFFDYGCGYSYEIALLLQRVRTSGERSFKVNWKYFSLTQVNSTAPGWTVWDAPLDEPVRGRFAFMAAELARREGFFDAMHWNLLASRHEQHASLEDVETLVAAARAAGYRPDDFADRLRDPTLLEALRRDHMEGAELGVFGTPTLVFRDGGAAYIRLRPAPAGAEAVAAFDELCDVVARRTYVREIKRPHARAVATASGPGPAG